MEALPYTTTIRPDTGLTSPKLGIWLFLTVLWPMLAPAIAQVIAPPDPRYAMLGLESPDTAVWSDRHSCDT